MNIRTRIAAVLLAVATLFGVGVAPASATSGILGHYGYYYFDANHRIVEYGRMQFAYTTEQLVRGYYASAWTEVRNSGTGVWSQVRFCASQDLSIDYSVRGNQPHGDWSSGWAINTSYVNFDVNALGLPYIKTHDQSANLIAYYEVDGSCLFPYNTSQSVIMTDADF